MKIVRTSFELKSIIRMLLLEMSIEHMLKQIERKHKNDVILEKDEKASIKYNHELSLEQFMSK